MDSIKCNNYTHVYIASDICRREIGSKKVMDVLKQVYVSDRLLLIMYLCTASTIFVFVLKPSELSPYSIVSTVGTEYIDILFNNSPRMLT